MTVDAELRELRASATPGPWVDCCRDRQHACRTGIMWGGDHETEIASWPEGAEVPRPSIEQMVANTRLTVGMENALDDLLAVVAACRIARECDSFEMPERLHAVWDALAKLDRPLASYTPPSDAPTLAEHMASLNLGGHRNAMVDIAGDGMKQLAKLCAWLGSLERGRPMSAPALANCPDSHQVTGEDT